MEIGSIVKGHVNEVLGLNDDLKEKRMKICLKCPLYKDTLGGICNSNLWLNPKTGDVSTEQENGYYRGCGCRLQAKTTLSTASCPAKKW
jgi:hypothetical protein